MYASAATDPWPTLPAVPGAQLPYNLDAGAGLDFLVSGVCGGMRCSGWQL